MGVLCKHGENCCRRQESLERFIPAKIVANGVLLVVGFSSFREYNNMNQIITYIIVLLESKKVSCIVK